MNVTKKTTITVAVIAIAAAVIFGAVAASSLTQNANAQASQSRLLIKQTTATSAPDPLPGHSMHQLVMVAPPRADGKVWDGDITWTSSVPVEVVVLHGYDSSKADDAHGEPLNASLPDNSGKVAITLYKVDSNTPAPSGSTHFDGTALAFHTLDGKPFTVTYTVKATAFSQTE